MFAVLLFSLNNTEKIAKLEFRTEKDSGSNLGQDEGNVIQAFRAFPQLLHTNTWGEPQIR